MSLILKGIDLPSKKLMEMFESDNHICIGGNYYPLMIKDVIQIPKDHGRLIDADALETVFKDMAKCEWNQKAFPISWAYAFEDTIDEIQDAPTILEAEDPKPSDVRPITGKLKYTLDVENGILTRGIEPEDE